MAFITCPNRSPFALWRAAAVAGLVGLLGALCAQAANAQDAQSMRARHTAMREALASSLFQRPLVLESTQADGNLKGDVYAVVAHPFSVVGPALQAGEHWCDVLIVHLNVKQCRARGAGAQSTVNLVVGRKFDQPLEDAYQVVFAYRLAASEPDYLQVRLDAEAGPLGTKNYRIVFEAVPLDANRSFVHMSYSYAYGMAARLAMEGYLATLGRDKVGFSTVGRKPDGSAEYVSSVRGLIERNTMRYFLAIEAYLGALALPPAQQADKRMSDWYTATERHARQLHEMERDEYITMKRKEVARQQASPEK